MIQDRPDSIEKRVYSCKECNYSAQVYGDTYFDSGCHNYMSTFHCPDCKVIFEGLITQIILEKMDSDAYHDLAEDFECLRCANKNAKVWNKAEESCPKCSAKMDIDVVGMIKLKWG